MVAPTELSLTTFQQRGQKILKGRRFGNTLTDKFKTCTHFLQRGAKKKYEICTSTNKQCVSMSTFVCLFVWRGGGSSNSRIFHLYRDVTMIEEGLQILTYLFCTHGHWAVRVFSVQHLLWHRASVHNNHLWVPVTFKPIVENLAVELSLPVFTTLVWDSNTQPSACGIRLLK